MQTIPEFEAQ